MVFGLGSLAFDFSKLQNEFNIRIKDPSPKSKDPDLMSSFLDTLKERIVVFDGAMGTSLQLQNLTLDDFGGPRFEGCNENLLVTRPDAVEKVHIGFLQVGCDVVETNSFNGTRVDFSEYGI